MDSKQKGPVKKRPDVGWDIVFANLLGSALYNLLKLPNAWLNILLFFVAIPLLTLNLHWYCWRQRQKRKQGESQPR